MSDRPLLTSIPSAVLTFLIADIRGYTRFSAEQGDRAAAHLSERFLSLYRDVVSAHGGEVFGSAGDQALAAFSSAHAALYTALGLQSRLEAEQAAHPELPLLAGIGLDTGEGIRIGKDYRGNAINLAARLCSLAGGGEIFASETVIQVARKVEGVAVVDRGEVTLKGIPHPVRVVQIAAEGALPSELPPLQPILVIHPNNLPDDPTPFIGREREIEQIAGLLREPSIRLVTLTGPGGTGKTRLALQVGNTLLHDFRDGAFFVDLSPLSDPTLVTSAIAEVLGVKEAGGRDLAEKLSNHLREKHLLLVLDNFEHLLDACGVVASLLDQCRELHVLVTSRIPLHLNREHEHAVPPLLVPDHLHLPDLQTLSQYESVALFIQRARAAIHTFAVNNENAAAVAEICVQLDGLPLAIELAAARIKLFPPQALLKRLSSRLTVLTGGARDRPGRQQTLRNAIDWSYSLLTEEEQTLFALLSVFAGGCTLEAAEAVCNPGGTLDVLEGIASLVDKSLVRQHGEEEPRFSMLETIREFAGEKLEDRGESEEARRRHAAYYLKMAEEANSELHGEQTRLWLDQLDAEAANLRAARDWSLSSPSPDVALRLSKALWLFWNHRYRWTESQLWLESTLAHPGEADPGLRAHALIRLAATDIPSERAKSLLEEGIRLHLQAGDRDGARFGRLIQGHVALGDGEFELARQRYEEVLALAREAGTNRGVAVALSSLANLEYERRDYPRARELFEEALQLERQFGDLLSTCKALFGLADVGIEQGDLAPAKESAEEAHSIAVELDTPNMIVATLWQMAVIALEEGDYVRAERLLQDGLRTPPYDMWEMTAYPSLAELATVWALQGKLWQAVCLWSASVEHLRTSPSPESHHAVARRERLMAVAREQLEASAWQTAWDEGEAMSLEAAAAYALDVT
jgi:predicted ATPase/class 3 adenylate cyclase